MCHNVLRQENDLTDYGTPICYNDMQPKKNNESQVSIC